MYLTFQVTLHDQLIEGSCEFLCGGSLWYVTTLISFVKIGIVMVEIKSISINTNFSRDLS